MKLIHMIGTLLLLITAATIAPTKGDMNMEVKIVNNVCNGYLPLPGCTDVECNFHCVKLQGSQAKGKCENDRTYNCHCQWDCN
ncbi:hypothetical protein HanXRQr2_Chr11g0516311 [Helianthus annuus]|uniref:S locus-related glycoprotein 1 binding pollen coat protein n=1 Tax=Helianthus annuus TaxID=4232 RepID=A0A251TH29_HELAN|nr:hypothetical protein HanXRQr2_Chr11g0516311 [Helianthus annuus]KAJ0877224.1 hypothetical protein HanPSC8_Chr11g0497621 [Helianthus annuus]